MRRHTSVINPNVNDVPYLGISAIVVSIATLVTALFTGVNLGRTTKAAVMAAERLAAAEQRTRAAKSETAAVKEGTAQAG